MADAPTVPPPHKAPAKAAHGLVRSLKGHPPWLYGVVIVGALGLAWYIRKRQQAAANASPMITGPDGAPATVDGYASAGYDTTAYPGPTQGAWTGSSTPGDESGAQAHDPTLSLPEWLDVWNAVLSTVGGGGAPETPSVETHTVPETQVPVPGQNPWAPPVITPVPTPPPPPPATPTPAPHVTQSGPQPNGGANVFYNADRNLQYIIQRHSNGKTYRHYESKLNKNDWGSGGVIPT